MDKKKATPKGSPRLSVAQNDIANTTAPAANNHVFSQDEINNLKIPNTSIHTQRKTILRILQNGACDTITFRDTFGICAPAPRIHELRHDQGYPIGKRFITKVDTAGVEHKRIALYFLQPSKGTQEVAA